jgi:hypothetical protein
MDQSWDGWFTKTSGSPVATVIESLLRGPMRISAPGDCNHALRQSSGALAVQTGLLTVVGDPVDGSSKFGRVAPTLTDTIQ